MYSQLNPTSLRVAQQRGSPAGTKTSATWTLFSAVLGVGFAVAGSVRRRDHRSADGDGP
ncbi:hypothetical protein [Halonotius roseus]|uniref:hypothetical protein n=1 Tax=Halonotius roseus TaxID=2511997 RepID=UPI00163C86A2|nr:hypothetical protein [Halonotius roseus]